MRISNEMLMFGNAGGNVNTSSVFMFGNGDTEECFNVWK